MISHDVIYGGVLMAGLAFALAIAAIFVAVFYQPTQPLSFHAYAESLVQVFTDPTPIPILNMQKFTNVYNPSGKFNEADQAVEFHPSVNQNYTLNVSFACSLETSNSNPGTITVFIVKDDDVKGRNNGTVLRLPTFTTGEVMAPLACNTLLEVSSGNSASIRVYASYIRETDTIAEFAFTNVTLSITAYPS